MNKNIEELKKMKVEDRLKLANELVLDIQKTKAGLAKSKEKQPKVSALRKKLARVMTLINEEALING
jgi:ribosomal protein L29